MVLIYNSNSEDVRKKVVIFESFGLTSGHKSHSRFVGHNSALFLGSRVFGLSQVFLRILVIINNFKYDFYWLSQVKSLGATEIDVVSLRMLLSAVQRASSFLLVPRHLSSPSFAVR